MRVVELPNGETLTIRETQPDDTEGIGSLYASLSGDDKYRRFFSGSGVPIGFPERWVHVAEEGGVGLVAVASNGARRIVGEAGYSLLPDGDGELAIVVAPDWRGWLGTFLLDALVEAAAERGVPNLQAEILLENRPMLSLVRRRGYATLGSSDWSSIRVAISTTGRTPSWPALHDRPRVLVEAPSSRVVPERAAGRADVQVMTCSGPSSAATSCPVLEGRPCPLATGADAIVFALRPSDPHAQEVLESHPRLHGDVPLVVLTPPASAGELDVPADAIVLPGCTTGAQILSRVRQLLDEAATTRAR